MPIRLNIPAWGPAELVAGTRALLPLPVRPLYVERLRVALQRAVPDRQPVPVRSARFGIALAIRALGLTGRRIAVPGYVCPAVLTGLRTAPAEPVPIDCLPGSVRFDPQFLRREAAAGRIDAVLAPNTYGADQEFETLAGLGLPVIEDAAYQAGHEDAAGRACGGRGAAGVWSFNFKALTAVGGGVLWLPADLLALAQEELSATAGETETAARFLNYALRGILRHRIPGFLPGFAPPGRPAPPPPPNTEPRAALLAPCEGKMSEIQAALAYAQWRQRDVLTAAQRARARQITGVLARCSALASLPGLAPDGAVHLVPVLVTVPSATAAAAVLYARRILHTAGVQTEEAYPVLFDAALPHTRDLAARLFLVPAGPALGARQLARIASALEQASEEIDRQLGSAPEGAGATEPESTGVPTSTGAGASVADPALKETGVLPPETVP